MTLDLLACRSDILACQMRPHLASCNSSAQLSSMVFQGLSALLLLVTGGQGKGHCCHQGASPAAGSRRCIRYHLSLSSTSDQTHLAARSSAKADERLWAAQGQSGSWQRGCPGFASRSVEADRRSRTDMKYQDGILANVRGNCSISAEKLMRYNKPYNCWSKVLATRGFWLSCSVLLRQPCSRC